MVGCVLGLASAMEASKPYLLMMMRQLSLAILINLLHSVMDPSLGFSPIVLVVYQQLVSSAFLSSLALLFEWGRRPKPPLKIIYWAFLVGFVQIVLGELMFTASLRYVTATFQSVSMNTIPVIVFLLAVASGRERFRFRGLYGQAKLWGTLVSAGGAAAMVVLSAAGGEDATSTRSVGGQWVGFFMVGVAVLAESAANLLVEKLSLSYPADVTLSAMMNIFGTIQTIVVAALIETDISSWRISWREGRLLLITILYAGVMVTGVSYYALIYCIHKKGPVFGSSFSPMLIVFSFLMETLIFGEAVHLGSIVGAVLVVGGLYLLLWAKSKDNKIDSIEETSVRDHLIQRSSAINKKTLC